MIRHWLTPVPLYPMRLCVVVTDSQAELSKFMRKNAGIEGQLDELYCYTTQGLWLDPKLKRAGVEEYAWHCIYMVFRPDKIKEPHAVAHEALHAVLYTLEHIGQSIDSGKNEPAAYLLEWIVAYVLSRKC